MMLISSEAERLLRELRADGYRLELRGDLLGVRPRPPEGLADRIRANKPELVVLVQAGEHRWHTVDRGTIRTVRIGSDLWAIRELPGGGEEACHVRRLDREQERELLQ